MLTRAMLHGVAAPEFYRLDGEWKWIWPGGSEAGWVAGVGEVSSSSMRIFQPIE